MKQLEDAFTARLMNLSAVHKHLSESEWQSASVPDLVRAAVEPYCAPGSFCYRPDRLIPRDFPLDSRANEACVVEADRQTDL